MAIYTEARFLTKPQARAWAWIHFYETQRIAIEDGGGSPSARHCTGACFRGNSFAVDATRDVIVPILETVAPNLLLAIIDSVNGGHATTDGVRVLELFFATLADARLLKHLEVAHLGIGIHGIGALLPAFLGKPYLVRLCVRDIGLGAQSITVLVNAIVSDAGTNSLPYRILDFDQGNTGDEGGHQIARLFAKSDQLVVFRMKDFHVEREGADSLASAMENSIVSQGQNKGIIHLSLIDVKLTEVVTFQKVLNAIGCLDALKELDLSDDGLTDDNLKMLMEALKASKCKLECLAIEGNCITDVGVECITEYIASPAANNLKTIIIGNHDDITTNGIIAFMSSFLTRIENGHKNPIERICLDQIELEDNFDFVGHLRRTCGPKVLPKLIQLSVGDGYVSEEMKVELQAFFCQKLNVIDPDIGLVEGFY